MMTHAVNMARNVAAEVARGRHKGSNPYAELILKLAWGPNFLSRARGDLGCRTMNCSQIGLGAE